MDGGDNEKYLNIMAQFIEKNHINHTFWCINPNSGDTGGLLKDDWTTWDDAKYEISQLKELLHQLYRSATAAYQNEDFDALAKANTIEEEIDDYTKRMEEGHIARMEKGICTPTVGAQYLELSSNAERMADHMINLAKSIRSL